MQDSACSAVGCYLEQQGGLVSLPLVTLAGLADGINPCAISMIVLLLGYLVVFLKKREKVLPTALVYIGTVYLSYLLFGLFLYRSYDFLASVPGAGLVNMALAGGLIVFGFINIKDYFYPEVGPHLRIPGFIRPKLNEIARNATYSSTVVLGVLVTLFESPCSLPLYAGTARVLYESGMAAWQVVGYFLYYNFLFVLPLIVVAGAFVKGVDFLKIEDMTHGSQFRLKLVSGIVLIVLGLLILFW